jgi:ribosome-binding protein aMBF1 (putative translation factor)
MIGRLDWKLRRIAGGYRQQDVAARIGMSGTRYSALERGEAEPKGWETKAVEKLLPPLPQTVPARESQRQESRAEVHAGV